MTYEHEHEHSHPAEHSHRHAHKTRPTAAHERSGMGAHHHSHAAASAPPASPDPGLLQEAAQRLSDAIANQAAVGTDGLFSTTVEFDARQEYLAALRDLRTALSATPNREGE